MNNFIKKEYEKGNIYYFKDSKAYEILDEYYISEEEADYYIEKHKNKTKEFEIGDIIFVKSFKYNNGNIGKNHLFVIVDKNNKIIPIEYFGMILSSNLEKKKYKNNLVIKKNNTNNLNKDSIIKTDYIYYIKNSDIEFYVGKVSKGAIKKYNKIYKKSKELVYE